MRGDSETRPAWLPRERSLRLLRLAPDNVVPVVGAGLSSGAGLPSGRDLAAFLREQDLAGACRFSAPENCVAVAAEIIGQDDARRREVSRRVSEHLRLPNWPDRVLTPALRAVVRASSGWILTFNYDLLLEEAAQAEGIRHETLSRRDLFAAAAGELLHQRDEGAPLRIVHLHGHVDDEDLVLSPASYREQAERHEVSSFLASALARFHACFLGFGLDELYLLNELARHGRSESKHVLVTDRRNADAMLDGRAALLPSHGIEVEAFPADEWEHLDDFCHWLTSAQPRAPAPTDRDLPTVAAEYVANQLVPWEEPTESGVTPAMRLAFGLASAVSEQQLAIRHRTVVRGSPGSGKTGLLARIGWLAPDFEEPLLVRLGREHVPGGVVGDGSLTLVDLAICARRFGPATPVEKDALRERPFHFLVDGLDELPSSAQSDVARALRDLAAQHPEHRFTIAARPVAALEVFDEPWEHLQLAPDSAFRDRFLARYDLRWRDLVARTPALRDLSDLFQLPFFLRALVDLVRREAVPGPSSPLSFISSFVDHCLATPELEDVSAPVRRWLQLAAVQVLLSDLGLVSRETLASIPDPAPSDAIAGRTVADFLVDRTLLEADGESYGFVHRLLAEALVAERLVEVGPKPELIAFLAPTASESVKGVRSGWAATVALALGASYAWRRALGDIDALAVAGAVPSASAHTERITAAQRLWRTYSSWRIWIHPRGGVGLLNDAETLARLLGTDGLDPVRKEVARGLDSPCREIRANAIEVLGLSHDPNTTPYVRRLLLGDDDAVVRRQAAMAAVTVEASCLWLDILELATTTTDESEAQVLSLALRELCPVPDLLHVGLALVESPFGYLGLIPQRMIDEGQYTARLRLLAAEVLTRTSYRAAEALDEVLAKIQSDDVAARLAAFIAAVIGVESPRLAALADENPHAFAVGVADAFRKARISAFRASGLTNRLDPGLLALHGAPTTLVDLARRSRSIKPLPMPEPAQEEPPAEPEPPTLAQLLESRDPSADADILRNARYFKDQAAALASPHKEKLAKLIRRSWPTSGIASTIQRNGGTWSIEHRTIAALCFGPAVELKLTPNEWADLANRPISYADEAGWLRSECSEEAISRLLDICDASEASTWECVLEAIPDPIPGPVAHAVAQRMTDIDQVPAATSVIRRLGENGHVDALRVVSRMHPELSSTTCAHLAAAGDRRAQTEKLRGLMSFLSERQREEDIGWLELDWMRAVDSPEFLDDLFDLLPVSYRYKPGPRGFNDSISAIHEAIRRIGGLGAVERYDELLEGRRPSWDGVHFVRYRRDELVADLLDREGGRNVVGFRDALLGGLNDGRRTVSSGTASVDEINSFVQQELRRRNREVASGVEVADWLAKGGLLPDGGSGPGPALRRLLRAGVIRGAEKHSHGLRGRWYVRQLIV